MLTNLQIMKCGSCGGKFFEIYKSSDSDKYFVCECTRCQSTSKITLTEPKLMVDWMPSSNGILSVFPEDQI